MNIRPTLRPNTVSPISPVMQLDVANLCTPKTKLAHGGEATVYCPFHASQFTDKRISLPPGRRTYIIKLFKEKIPKEYGYRVLSQKYHILYEHIKDHDRRYFRLPIRLGLDKNDMIYCEIQEYGGGDLMKYLMNNERKDIPPNLLSSLKKICRLCLDLVLDHAVFLTDIKPENMVMRDDGTISLIDFDIVILNKQKKSFMSTPNPFYMPIQFISILSRYMKVDQKKVKKIYEQEEARLPSAYKYIKRRQIKDASEQRSDKEISAFTILWVFLNIIYLILKHKGDKESSRQFYKKYNQKLYLDRIESIKDLKDRLSKDDGQKKQTHIDVAVRTK